MHQIIEVYILKMSRDWHCHICAHLTWTGLYFLNVVKYFGYIHYGIKLITTIVYLIQIYKTILIQTKLVVRQTKTTNRYSIGEIFVQCRCR